MGSELTLEQAIDIARTYELAPAQLQTMVGEDRTVEVHGLNHKQNESKCNKTHQNSGQWGMEKSD